MNSLILVRFVGWVLLLLALNSLAVIKLIMILFTGTVGEDMVFNCASGGQLLDIEENLLLVLNLTCDLLHSFERVV